MTSFIILHKIVVNLAIFTPKCDLKVILICDKKNKIHAPVLLNLLNLMRKSDKMFCKPHTLSLFLNLFKNLRYSIKKQTDEFNLFKNLRYSIKKQTDEYD